MCMGERVVVAMRIPVTRVVKGGWWLIRLGRQRSLAQGDFPEVDNARPTLSGRGQSQTNEGTSQYLPLCGIPLRKF
ncbi:hypothetical protein [Pasteuria penetrans]|uniref:hypothetical protein n=1 Tax=Pasteuria penetrans TaxID=86005 RepID=UPI000F99B5C1|nr:hypothetical protein [Pasteuria penetrans]